MKKKIMHTSVLNKMGEQSRIATENRSWGTKRHSPRLHQHRLERTATGETFMHGNRKRVMVYLKISPQTPPVQT